MPVQEKTNQTPNRLMLFIVLLSTFLELYLALVTPLSEFTIQIRILVS